MVIHSILTLTLIQIVVGQGVPQQQQIIRSAPVVVPNLECFKSPGANFASLLASAPQSERFAVQPQSQPSAADEADSCDCCCCCSADDGNDSQAQDQGPSFGVAMLGPLATMLTSLMSGFGGSGNQVTIDFNGQSLQSNPNDQPQPDESQSVILPSNNVASNMPPSPPPSLQSRSLMPPSSPPTSELRSLAPIAQSPLPSESRSLAPTAQSPLPSESRSLAPIAQSPHYFPSAENRLAFGACQCYSKSKKRVPDIEEDSLYAFAQNNPEKTCSRGSHIEPAFQRAFIPQSSYPTETTVNQNGVRMLRTTDTDQNTLYLPQTEQRGNPMIQHPSTGNPEFDSISRISALLSTQNNNLNMQSSSQEQSLMPCQCLC